MKKWFLKCFMAAGVAAAAGHAARADTFLPGDASVRYAASVGGFYVNSVGQDLNDGTSWASADNYGTLFGVQAGDGYTAGAGYADAGIVLGMDGSLTLGELAGVHLNYAASDHGNATPSVNLWLDTGGDHQFFAFSGDQFTGLNGDSYFGATTPGDVNAATTFTFLGGSGIPANFTLAQLQAGADPGVNGNTRVALWVGVTSSGAADYPDYKYANITSVDVATAPLPGVAWGGLALLGGLVGVTQLKRLRGQPA